MCGCNNDCAVSRKAAATGEIAAGTTLATATTTTVVAATATATGAAVGAVVATVYCGKYLYERFKWTNEAKGSAFKRQYVAHATGTLRLIVGETSANCSNQVEQ